MPDPTRVPGLARLAPSIAFNSRVYCSARASSGASGAVISKTVPFRCCPPPPAMSGLAWRCSNAAAVRAVRLSPSCSAGTIKGSGWPPACGSGEDRRRHVSGNAAPAKIAASVAPTPRTAAERLAGPTPPGQAAKALRAAIAPATPPSSSAAAAIAPPSSSVDARSSLPVPPTARRRLNSGARPEARTMESERIVSPATATTAVATPSSSSTSVTRAVRRRPVGLHANVLHTIPRS